jgi:hypothetical protein
VLVEALQGFLTTDPGMIALLGTPAARPDSTNGVFPVQAPDGPTMPYLVMNEVSGNSLSVTYAGTGVLTHERWRLSCYGTTYKNAKTFQKYVKQLLVSWLGVQPVGNATIRGAFIAMETDEQENLGKGTLFSSIVDFDFNYDDNDTYAA